MDPVSILTIGLALGKTILAELGKSGAAQEVIDLAQAGVDGFAKAQAQALTLQEAESLRVSQTFPDTPNNPPPVGSGG